jgi:hypothetical protein
LLLIAINWDQFDINPQKNHLPEYTVVIRKLTRESPHCFAVWRFLFHLQNIWTTSYSDNKRYRKKEGVKQDN